ncbi:3-hydroxyacyl-CoA dehydrogenase family protein, partial [Oceaniglobus roseus]|uniref:3-hydroxyacyl-CoA dehydrogenase family protein n=1 Tax=Oceaniglobus roseus TaxID=1737570 RepID=UPI000C7F1FC4
GSADPAAFMAATAKARRAQKGQPVEAGRRIVECVEASILVPYETGMEMELAAWQDCAAGAPAKALSALAAAEAAAWDMPEAAGADPAPLRRIAVVGATARAAAIVAACLDAGLEVALVELDPTARAEVLERVLAAADGQVEQGRLGEEERDRRLARLSPEAGFEDLAGVDAVWEAAPDSVELKRELWRAIGLMAAPGALLLSATGSLGIGALGAAAERPGEVLALHVPGSGQGAPLAELVIPAGAAGQGRHVATAVALARRLGKRVVRSADRAGFVVQRLQTALELAIESLLIAGAKAEAVDDALIAYGLRAAPCLSMDAEGLDRVLARRHRIAGRGVPVVTGFTLLDALVEVGLKGRESGAGLMGWREGRPGGKDESARAVMQAMAEADNVTPRAWSAEQIQQACLAALANEGARMVEDGTVLRAGDIDVAAVHALGFPRWRGGPMIAADQRGLVAIERELGRSFPGLPVSPLFSARIKEGAKLSGAAL